MLQGIVSGAIWFLIFLVTHVLWFHLFTVERCAKVILNIFGGCFLGHLFTIVLLNSDAEADSQIILRMCYGTLVMGCLFILYMPFYYTIATSLSVQSLIYLD